MQEEKPLLEVSDLSIHFHTENGMTVGTENISFTVAKKETLAIVGESGSGKSISALSLLGLLPMPPAEIASGEALFRNTDLFKLSKSKLEEIRGNEIAMIFQEPMTSLNPLKKCGEQIIEALLLHNKISKKEALTETIRLFEEVRLPNPERLVQKYPHEISGGQKQRVMIAMAISCNPRILIADEPTTALDVSVQRTILDLLKELQSKYEMAILFITHDLGLVNHFADRVLVMNKGKVVEQGLTQQIFNTPTQDYTKGLIHCRPNAEENIKFLPQVEDFLVEDKEPLIEKSKILSNPVESKSENVFKKIRISETDRQKRLASLVSAESILETKNLFTWYPVKKNFFGKTTSWFEALNNVSLEIKQGETLGIVGESGCGKTTLGKSIVGLADITKGEIFYQGKSLTGLTKSEQMDYKKDVQIIFQDPYSSLNPRMSIGQAIREPMDVHKIHSPAQRKQEVISLLEKVGMQGSQYNRYPHEFSGGQRQRICIARALAVSPKLIICDESVSALDVSVQAQVLNLLVKLREEYNLTYLFISHDISVVKHISDRIAVMNQGRIVEYNDAESIYHHAEQEYTKELIANSLFE